MFKFLDLEFSNICINRYEEYPWTNKKEKNAFYEKLIEDASDASKEKTKIFLKKEALELIHINISKAIVYCLSSIIFFIIAMLGSTIFSPWSIVFLCIVTWSFLVAASIKLNRAKKEYISLKFIDTIVNTIFEMENNIKKKLK